MPASLTRPPAAVQARTEWQAGARCGGDRGRERGAGERGLLLSCAVTAMSWAGLTIWAAFSSRAVGSPVSRRSLPGEATTPVAATGPLGDVLRGRGQGSWLGCRSPSLSD